MSAAILARRFGNAGEGAMASDQKEIENLLGQLCDIIDQLERRLRIYDSAFCFFKANNKKYASLLDDSLVLAERLSQLCRMQLLTSTVR